MWAMDYKGQWEAPNISDDITSLIVILSYKEEKLMGSISFIAKRRTEATNLIVTLLEDSFHFVSEPPTVSGYTINFNGKPIDDNTIEGTLNIGIHTDRVERTVTFKRKSEL
jgi:hypothetical protein